MTNPSTETTMLREVREQGEVLRRVHRRLAPEIEQLLPRIASKRLHLVGCGDMYFAAAQAAALVESQWAVSVRPWRSMDLRWASRRFNRDDVVVCASVSGRTPRTVEAARLARRHGAIVLGITDNRDSPLHEAVDDVLLLGTTPRELLEDKAYAGYRHIIAQTQSFTATLLAELMLMTAMNGIEMPWGNTPDRVRALVDQLEAPAQTLAPVFFAGGQRVVVLGSGPHRPAAMYGAAKMLEFAIPATAQCIEEFNHLDVFVADGDTRVLLLAADQESGARGAELTGAWESLGICSLVLALDGTFPGAHTQRLQLPARDLLDAVFCQIVALQLLVAHGVAAMGRDPDRWLGGRRTDRIQDMSQHTIRGSQLWGGD
jgi:glucosamine--fructose-6-phosphate aminotransferase (isomerizing)